jgi:uncharacterized protein (TIGR02996 family)
MRFYTLRLIDFKRSRRGEAAAAVAQCSEIPAGELLESLPRKLRLRLEHEPALELQRQLGAAGVGSQLVEVCHRWYLVHPRSSALSWVDVEGRRVAFVGPGGKSGSRHASASAAAEAAGRLIADREREGWRAVENIESFGEGTGAREQQLEAGIAAAPDDEERYLVYADWLQQRGDVRGELIVLQHAMERAPPGSEQRQTFKRAADRVVKKNATRIFGDLAYSGALDYLEADWRWGFLRGVRVGGFHRQPPFEVGPMLRVLFALPVAIALEELSWRADECEAVTSTIGKLGPGSLRRLALHGAAGHLSGLGGVLRQLESLQVRGSATLPPRLDSPGLRELVLHIGLDQRQLESLERADLPGLESLELSLGSLSPYLGGEAVVTALESTLNRTTVEAIRICGSSQAWGAEAPVHAGDALCRAVSLSPCAGSLTSLDLTETGVTDHGAAILAQNAHRFAELERLILVGNNIGREGLRRLRRSGLLSVTRLEPE